MLHAHGHNIYEEALVVLRTVKDELNRVECVTKFEIDEELIKETRSWSRRGSYHIVNLWQNMTNIYDKKYDKAR